MVTKRDWLRQQGFTVGKRGRFSQEQLTALADSNLVFDDGIIEQVGDKIKAPPKPASEPGWVLMSELERRDLPDYYVVGWYDNKNKLHKQRWEICYECHYSIKFCTCIQPTMPPWMVQRGARVLDNDASA